MARRIVLSGHSLIRRMLRIFCIIHGSDGEKSAAHEIAYWFSESEIADWNPTISSWLYE